MIFSKGRGLLENRAPQPRLSALDLAPNLDSDYVAANVSSCLLVLISSRNSSHQGLHDTVQFIQRCQGLKSIILRQENLGCTFCKKQK